LIVARGVTKQLGVAILERGPLATPRSPKHHIWKFRPGCLYDTPMRWFYSYYNSEG
jgi:hypothetical protein